MIVSLTHRNERWTVDRPQILLPGGACERKSTKFLSNRQIENDPKRSEESTSTNGEGRI